jgi:hypothetical protein
VVAAHVVRFAAVLHVHQFLLIAKRESLKAQLFTKDETLYPMILLI